ncbi:MAG: dolichol kinase [Cyanobacteriota bacterium]|nr:dolichol kinase [Cyanobacteriota bacterium]
MGGWQQQLIACAAVAAWLVLVTLAALAVRARWPQQREWSRKLVHIGSGPVVLIAWALAIDRAVAVLAAAGVTLLAGVNHRLRVLPAIEDVGRASYGTVAYGAAITTLLLLYWPGRADAAAAGVMVMALGDGAAGLVGPAVASPSWLVLGQRKSLAGTAAMAAAAVAALGLVAAFSSSGTAPSAATLLLITAAAVALEQVAVLGSDNYSVPVVVGALWAWLRP